MQAPSPPADMRPVPPPGPPAPHGAAGPRRDTPDLSALVGLLRTLWQQRAIFAGVTVTILLLAGLGAGQLTPSYRASAEIILAPRERRTAADAEIGTLPTARPDIASEIEIITSRSLLAGVVAAETLLNDPAFNPAKRKPGGLLHALGLQARAAQADLSPAAQRARAIAMLRDRLSVRPLGRSRVIEISVTAGSGGKAAGLANAIADRYLRARRETGTRMAQKATEGLRSQVESLRQSLEAAERKASRYRRKAGLLDAGAADIARDRLSTLTQDLEKARARRREAADRLSGLERTLRNGGPKAVAERRDTGTMGELRHEMAELQRRQAELAATYGRAHPKMQAIAAELRTQRQALSAEVRGVLAKAREDATLARRRVSALQRRMTRTQARLESRQARRVRLNELERKVTAEREVYQTLLAQLKRRSVAAMAKRPAARVLSRADPPRDPASPNIPLLMGLTLLAAIPTGMGAAILRAHTASGIANRPEAEAATGVPALALVPEIPNPGANRSPADLVLDRPGSLFADATQRLVTGLQYARAQTPLHSILITSPDTREGKSTLALALARVLVRRGERVLLIEADLRKPQLRRTLRQRGRGGLADVLRGEIGIEKALRLDPRSDLHVLHAGLGGPAAGTLIDGPDMAALLTACTRHYDRVVIDAPPVLVVNDTQRLAPLADVTLLALRWGRTRPDMAERALADLKRAEADVAGLAITRIDRRRYAHDGAGDEVAYGREARAYYAG